jgi:hypothetical protein
MKSGRARLITKRPFERVAFFAFYGIERFFIPLFSPFRAFDQAQAPGGTINLGFSETMVFSKYY